MILINILEILEITIILVKSDILMSGIQIFLLQVLLLGEEAYLSCFDFAEPSFNREEMFIKITQPEIVQMMKIIAFWDFENGPNKWKQAVNGLDLVFDSGNTTEGYLSKYAEEEIIKRIQPETTLWIVSSWHPDELVNSIREASMNGCEVNMLINRPYEIESLKKIPHSLTKIASKYRFQRDTNGIDYNIYQPTGNQFHAKFILMENAGQFWWFVGTTNHTYFGSQAKTTELGIAGQDFLVGCQLQSYIKKINKQRV